ncbi:MAG: HNH endonuclease [Actinomycetota bacterium]|nr:HNH endonuclease [Actinomycetota bacterium]
METVVDLAGLDLPGLESLHLDDTGHARLADLVAHLTSLDVAAVPHDFDVVEVVAAWERVTAAATAAQHAAVAELARRPEVIGADDDPDVQARRAHRAEAGTNVRPWLGDELAARTTDSRWTWERRGRAARDLPHRFPVTWSAFQRGVVSEAKARVLVDGCAALDDDLARAVDTKVGPRAPRLTPSRLRQAVKRCILRLDPASAVERRARAVEDRRVQITATDDGMAELYALLPAPAAAALERALDVRARSARAAGDERTLEQLRADLLTDGITTSVELQVLVPASVLLGLSDEPGELAGFGAVDADLARVIAGDATWRRILTDPDGGGSLSVSQETYRPGAVLARQVQARDRSCRFPGCDRAAAVCDIDHTVPFPDGQTAEDNLGLLCRRHHRFKHSGPDPGGDPPRLEQPTPGQFVWSMPTGHTYVVEPERQMARTDALAVAADNRSSRWSPAERSLLALLAS